MFSSSSFPHKKCIQVCISFWSSTLCFFTNCYYFLLIHVNHFGFHLFYFFLLSLFGFLFLKASRPRSYPHRPRDLDLFFTSVSASTISSMSTVEMEVFSNSQLIILAFLMFLGGEVFTSMVGLYFQSSKLKRPSKTNSRVNVLESLPNFAHDLSIEMASTSPQTPHEPKPIISSESILDPFMKYNSIKLLAYLVSAYLVTLHVIGTLLVLAYLGLISSARNVLKTKGLSTFTFSVFTVVSTFANCGFIPTNENMVVFRKNSGLLLILIPQILLGNTLFPSCLRLLIWVLGKVTKKEETSYLLRNAGKIKYLHLLPSLHSIYLVVTVLGFVVVQFIMLCSMEWHSQALSGMSPYQKVVGVFFLCINSRYTGETIVDISSLAPAILVLFVAMMYLPPYTSFLPTKSDENQIRKKSTKPADKLLLSQLSYLVMFVIGICITERKSMKADPLNFSLLNIVVEVISAYGNVGFTTGYSCDRRIEKDGNCTSKWFGFAGAWSDEGKLILILVMVFGRLKKFSMNGGKAWKLL